MARLVTDATPAENRETRPEPAAPAGPGAPQAAAPPPVDDGPPKKLKPKLSTVLVMALVAVVGIGVILYAWRLGPFASTIASTENSYVRGQITVLAPRSVASG